MAAPKDARSQARQSSPVTHARTGLQAQLTCPVCDQGFLGHLPAPATFVGRESDLRPLFHGELDPLTTLIQVCPRCGFAAYPRAFGHRGDLLDELETICTQSPGDRPLPHFGPLDEQTRADLRRWLEREREYVNLIGPAHRYLFAARCHDYVSADNANLLADYFLRASWAARSSGDYPREVSCRAEAIDRLWTAVDDEMQPVDDKVRALFLLGELSRRQGDFATAVDLFTQIEDFAAESAESNEQADPEVLFFSRQAERMLPLACMKSDVNAQLGDIDESEALWDDEDEDEGRGGQHDPGELI